MPIASRIQLRVRTAISREERKAHTKEALSHKGKGSAWILEGLTEFVSAEGPTDLEVSKQIEVSNSKDQLHISSGIETKLNEGEAWSTQDELQKSSGTKGKVNQGEAWSTQDQYERTGLKYIVKSLGAQHPNLIPNKREATGQIMFTELGHKTIPSSRCKRYNFEKETQMHSPNK